MDTRILEQQLECPICLERFQSPKMLPCQHTFCQHCLEGCANGTAVECPECRQRHVIPRNGIRGFPTSVAIQRLIEAANTNQPQQRQPPAPVNNNAPQPRQPTMPYGHAIHPSAPFPLQPSAPSFDDTVVTCGQNDTRTQGSQGRTEPTSICALCFILFNRQPIRPGSAQRKLKACFDKSRQIYQRYLEHMLKMRSGYLLLIPWMFIITFARFIAGAVKLGSDCEDEYNAAVYSFVKAILGFVFHITISVLLTNTTLERRSRNMFVQLWLLIHGLFSLIWLLIGSVWVLGNYRDLIEVCKSTVEDWNFHFINFILFLTVVDWIITLVFVIVSLYFLCAGNEESTVRASSHVMY